MPSSLVDSSTIPLSRLNHSSCRIPPRQPRGALEPADVLPAVEVVLSVVNVVSFMTKPLLNRKTARQICTPVATALRLAYGSGDMRPFHRPPGNSRFAGLRPDSKVILRVEIAESSVKRAFRGVCPPPFPYSPGLQHPTANSQAYTVELI